MEVVFIELVAEGLKICSIFGGVFKAPGELGEERYEFAGLGDGFYCAAECGELLRGCEAVVCHRGVELYCEAETGGCFFGHALERRRGWNAVICRIYLDYVEMGGVVVEHGGGGEFFGIERAFPVLEAVAGCADSYGHGVLSCG